ncbi:hypothetical protein [Alkalibacillus silvisoli]|uniref:Uncharacterized protein n=1 Tax=Alkalibacillus silvisoli TaxID=392823 RepID=A0ABP3JKE7_9BACI
MQYRLFNTKEVEKLQERLKLYENMFQDFYESEAFEDYLLMKQEMYALKKQIVKIEGVLKVVNEHQQEQDQKIDAQKSGQSEELEAILRLLHEVKSELVSMKDQLPIATEQPNETEDHTSADIEVSINENEDELEEQSQQESTQEEPIAQTQQTQPKETSPFLLQAKQMAQQKQQTQQNQYEQQQTPRQTQPSQPKPRTQQNRHRPSEFKQLQNLVRSNGTGYIQPDQPTNPKPSNQLPSPSRSPARFKTRVGTSQPAQSGKNHSFKPRNHPSRFDQIQPRAKKRKKKRRPAYHEQHQPNPTNQSEPATQAQPTKQPESKPTPTNNQQSTNSTNNQQSINQQQHNQSNQEPQSNNQQSSNQNSVLENLLLSPFFRKK